MAEEYGAALAEMLAEEQWFDSPVGDTIGECWARSLDVPQTRGIVKRVTGTTLTTEQILDGFARWSAKYEEDVREAATTATQALLDALDIPDHVSVPGVEDVKPHGLVDPVYSRVKGWRTV